MKFPGLPSLALLAGGYLLPAQAQEAISLDTLKDMSLEDLLQIEIVSKKAESKHSAAGIVSVITRDEINRYGGNNLADVLNRVTSLYMLSTYIWSNSTAALRGDALTHVNNHTLVLLDGRPFRDSAYGGLTETMFRNFPLHHIEQIEVIRGPGSVLYGTNAFSGVINIVTQKRKDTGLTLRGRYGSFATGQFESEFAWKDENAALTGAVRYQGSDGWLSTAIDERNNAVGFRNNADDISTSLRGDWGDFTFNLLYVDNHRNHWGAVPIGSGQPIENERLFFDVGFKHQFNEHWNSTWNVTFNKFGQNYNLPVAGIPYMTDLYENNVLFEQTHFLNFFDNKLQLIVGGLVEWQQGGVKQFSQPNTLAPYMHLKSSLYGEINYALLDNLKLTLGGQWHRFDHLRSPPAGVAEAEEAIEDEVGRAGLVYALNDNWGAKLLYSQAYRSPSAGELGASSALVTGNRSVRPELIETVDAQVFYHDRDHEASVTVFRSRVSNLIVRSPIPDTQPVRLLYVNAGSAIFEGIEFESKAKLLDNLTMQTAYTFQTNRDEFNNNNKTLLPNHMMKLGMSWDVSEYLQISAFDTYFSAAKVDAASRPVNPPADAYHNVTLNANYQLNHLLNLPFTERLTFTFYIDNLLNEKFYYPEFNRKILNTLPATAGRSLYGEFRISF